MPAFRFMTSDVPAITVQRKLEHPHLIWPLLVQATLEMCVVIAVPRRIPLSQAMFLMPVSPSPEAVVFLGSSFFHEKRHV